MNSKEWTKQRKINREGWPSGPWDNEPDFYEWTTAAGYEAYAGRLQDGCWYGVVTAPHPTEGTMLLAFSHTIRDKSRGKLCAGLVSKTDQEGVGEFCYSMEHYQSPAPREKKGWEPYKTLEDVKQHCEDAAQLIRKTHEEGTYVNYFQR